MKKQQAEGNRYIIWIDHKKAILGRFNNDNRFFHMIFRSGIETRIRFNGEGTNKTNSATFTRNRQSQLQHKHNQQLAAFCDIVVRSMENIVSVLVTGPADSKFIFKKELERKTGTNRFPVVVKTSDKMPLPLLKEYGRRYYRIPEPPRGLKTRPRTQLRDKVV